MKINTTKNFQKSFKKLFKKDKHLLTEYETLLDTLNNNSSLGVVIGEDMYKIRLQNKSNNKGKSGGYRVISYTKIEDTILLVDIYSKSMMETIKDDKIDTVIKEYLTSLT